MVRSCFVLVVVALAACAHEEAQPATGAVPPEGAQLTEAQKIERLIDAVGTLEGATFLRNGGEHTTAEATVHLRRKLQAGGAAIQTAAQFLEHAATRSSWTGTPYEVRFADGRVVPLAEFLREELRRLESR